MSKVLAIGDLHTKLWIVDAVRKIADNYDNIVFVGDYADDWGKEPIDTINTWQALKELRQSDKEKYHLVIGNHDYIYLHKTPTTSSGYSIGTQFLLDLPDNKELKAWLNTMPVSVELDRVTYSHAGFIQQWGKDMAGNFDLWRDDSPIWARPGKGTQYKNLPQVFGHTPSETCWEVEPNVWCIDSHSTYPDGTNIGDNTVLEIIDGKVFNVIPLI